MGPWWLYIIVFLFGYLTHKTFFFFRSARISIGIVRTSQLISLAVLAKSMENFYYSHTARLRHMREQNEDTKNIKDARRSFSVDISNYKESSIKEMLNLHPKFYDPIIDFDNWKSAMKYLEENNNYILQLLDRDKNDKENSR
jgi:hypothetical protein